MSNLVTITILLHGINGKFSIRWSAVARGAVCRGLEHGDNGLVAVRLARQHYGTPTSTPYIAAIHNEADAYIDKYTGRKYARGQMNWLVEKGDALPEGSSPKTMTISVCTHFTADEDRTIGAVLVGCADEIAPKRFADDGKFPTSEYFYCFHRLVSIRRRDIERT